MELAFLIGLLAVVVYLNRGMFGFGLNSCDWMSADTINEDGSRKWICNLHGTIVVTKDGSTPPDCETQNQGGAQS